MGAQLVAYYTTAKAKGGLEAQIKLAVLTKLSAKAAADVDDSPSNIKLFEDALKQI